ncbi:MAG: class I SAM-dependent methyltransferase [Acidobacteriota bacterium]
MKHIESRALAQLAAVFFLLSASCAAQPLRHPVSGRIIAPVMGAAGAGWLERSERELEERPSLAVKLLRLQPGQTAADIGAGSGYYTELLSKAVGPAGRVYSTDIQPEMIRLLDERIRRRGLSNVRTVLCSETDPRLPPGSLDLALLVDVYHELASPQLVLRGIRKALKPGGRLVLIEFRKEDPAVPIREEHKMSVAEARAEVEPEGFAFDRVLNDLPWQHILIFRK